MEAGDVESLEEQKAHLKKRAFVNGCRLLGPNRKKTTRSNCANHCKWASEICEFKRPEFIDDSPKYGTI